MMTALKIVGLWTMASFLLGLYVGPALRRARMAQTFAVGEGETPDRAARPDQFQTPNPVRLGSAQ